MSSPKEVTLRFSTTGGSSKVAMSSPSKPPPEPKGKAPQLLVNPKWLLVAIPAYLVTTYYGSIYVFQDPYKALGHQTIVDSMIKNPMGILHIAGSMLTMALSPLQFSRRLRRIKSPVNLHRWIGRLCNLGAYVGGSTGFYVAYCAGTYPIGRVGLWLSAAAWLMTAGVGMGMIWAGDVAGHRRWMTRSFALTYAAVMLRWQLPVYIKYMGMTTKAGLTLVAWTCWVPNVLFAEWYVRRPSFGKV